MNIRYPYIAWASIIFIVFMLFYFAYVAIITVRNDPVQQIEPTHLITLYLPDGTTKEWLSYNSSTYTSSYPNFRFESVEGTMFLISGTFTVERIPLNEEVKK